MGAVSHHITSAGTTVMPDPRFVRLRSDPRFRSLRKHKNKVVVDSRFSSVFSRPKKQTKIGVGRPPLR